MYLAIFKPINIMRVNLIGEGEPYLWDMQCTRYFFFSFSYSCLGVKKSFEKCSNLDDIYPVSRAPIGQESCYI